MEKHLFVVMSNARDGQDEEFNDWYTNIHLKDLVNIPGFVSAQRFKYADQGAGNTDEPQWRYLALYQVEAESLADAQDALTNSVSGGTPMYISPALDMERTVAWYYSPITEAVTR
jgi:hypothetical protein